MLLIVPFEILMFVPAVRVPCLPLRVLCRLVMSEMACAWELAALPARAVATAFSVGTTVSSAELAARTLVTVETCLLISTIAEPDQR